MKKDVFNVHCFTFMAIVGFVISILVGCNVCTVSQRCRPSDPSPQCSQPVLTLNVEKLSAGDIARVKEVLAKLTSMVERRRSEQTLAKLTFDELYAPLTPDEQVFVRQFYTLNGKELGIKIPFRGMATGKEELVLLKGQKVKNPQKGGMMTLPPQYLPKNVYLRYSDMMAAMKKDLGKRLYVESGYRSSAYQLYLVMFYLSNHDYSIRETVRFVALPGYSEHGSPQHQAIDFINEDGFGEEMAKQFEAQPEFTWLTKNAAKFGFVMSYPKNGKEGITYEPWHWRYEQSLDPACQK